MVRETVLERTAARALIARLVDAVPGRDDEVAAARPRLAAQDVRVPREARPRGRDPAAAEELDDRRTWPPFDMFNDVQDHVLTTAQTHIDRVVLEAFVAGVDRTTDPAARALLDTVCDLYALSTIEADKAWFLEHGRLTPARAKARDQHGQRSCSGSCGRTCARWSTRFAIPDALEGGADPRGGGRPPGGHGRPRTPEVRGQAEGSGTAVETRRRTAVDLEVAPAQ